MKDDRVYLWHIRDCIDRILTYRQEGLIELEARDDLKEDLERIKRLVARLGYY